MKKVGILTLPFEPNYGWILQLWALKTFLSNNGYEVEVIDRRWDDQHPSIIKDLIRGCYHHVFCSNFSRFFNRYFKRTVTIRNMDNMKEICNAKNYFAVITGSDQVWRIEHTWGVKYNFFLDFITNENTRKISYAASFGTDTWKGTEEQTKRVTELLKKFNLISVREDSGVTICSDVFCVNAYHVIDPTMLLNGKDYEGLFCKNKKKINEIVTYILDFNEQKAEMVDFIAQNKEIQKYHLYTRKKKLYTFYKPIEQWLFKIANADFVVVDSFHGMVFSILFHRQFIVIGNKKRGLTRFKSLLMQLGLLDRLISEDMSKEKVLSIIRNEIDYDKVELVINELRQKSKGLLMTSLSD